MNVELSGTLTGRCVLIGDREYDERQVNYMLDEALILSDCDLPRLPVRMAELFGFKIVPCDEGLRVDFIIDTDVLEVKVCERTE